MPSTTFLPGELAKAEAEVTKWYDHLIDIFPVTQATDVYGGTTETDGSAKATGVACAMIGGVAHTQDFTISMTEREMEKFTLTMPVATDIVVGDHVTVTSVTPTLHLEIQAVHGPESDQIEKVVIGVSSTELD